MKQELFWFTLTLILTAVMWMPYILNLFYKNGILPVMNYYKCENAMSEWALRAKAAHQNAIENLTLFAPAAILYFLMAGQRAGEMILCFQVYFILRIAHYVVYVAKLPYLRTVTFLGSWACIIALMLKVLNFIQQMA